MSGTTILGLDYGERRIGVALSDSGKTLAAGLMTIDCRSAGDPLDVACKILAIVTGGFPICGVLELLYDVGKFALQAAEAIVSAFAINDWGESESMPLPDYFNQHYLPHVERYAQNMRQNWNYWSNGIAELVGMQRASLRA